MPPDRNNTILWNHVAQNLNLILIMLLDVTTNFQKIQWSIKWHYKDLSSKIQAMGNLGGQKLLRQINFKEQSKW